MFETCSFAALYSQFHVWEDSISIESQFCWTNERIGSYSKNLFNEIKISCQPTIITGLCDLCWTSLWNVN